jgi:hypothetical protein
MLCSLWTDLIVFKGQCGESLCKTKAMRFDEKVRILHYFVVEHRQDVVLLYHRSDCRRGSVWWVSMWNKSNDRFDGKVGMLHYFVVEHRQDVVLLVDRSDCIQGSVWWGSMWKKAMRDLMKGYECYIVLL